MQFKKKKKRFLYFHSYDSSPTIYILFMILTQFFSLFPFFSYMIFIIWFIYFHTWVLFFFFPGFFFFTWLLSMIYLFPCAILFSFTIKKKKCFMYLHTWFSFSRDSFILTHRTHCLIFAYYSHVIVFTWYHVFTHALYLFSTWSQPHNHVETLTPTW